MATGRSIGDIVKGLKPQYEMVLSNDSDHAVPLHFTPPYFVIDPEHFGKEITGALVTALNTWPPENIVIENAMTAAGVKEIAHLRSFIGETRPGIAGGPPRPAHPGHWADIEKDVAKSYKLTVENDPVDPGTY